MGPQAKIENAFSDKNKFDDKKLADQFSEDYIEDEGLLEKSFIQISLEVFIFFNLKGSSSCT